MNVRLFKNKLKAIVALFTVLLIAGAAFAFTDAIKHPILKVINKKPTTNYRWFQISGNRTPAQSVASANAAYISTGTTAPTGTGCSGSTYQCVSGFDSTQVNASNHLIGSQTPQVVAYTKN
ncbi:hypothetical protein SAMN05216464_111163 [Mucilaginibacter pineti]|uniref:Uncharacterized protein n=1 Tax=Mucilaginibacter pineti TaxID=1391627 RepID=A0A1G7HCJ0_9SPHI|nr:hypothetical protein SAMN05216464_111163 [Mucilaginibacter pineti]